MKVLNKDIIYLVDMDLNLPEGKIHKPIFATYKEDVKIEGRIFSRFYYVNQYLNQTNDTFLIPRKQIDSFIDNKCSVCNS